jgi:hypothetical protein
MNRKTGMLRRDAGNRVADPRHQVSLAFRFRNRPETLTGVAECGDGTPRDSLRHGADCAVTELPPRQRCTKCINVDRSPETQFAGLASGNFLPSINLSRTHERSGHYGQSGLFEFRIAWRQK